MIGCATEMYSFLFIPGSKPKLLPGVCGKVSTAYLLMASNPNCSVKLRITLHDD